MQFTNENAIFISICRMGKDWSVPAIMGTEAKPENGGGAQTGSGLPGVQPAGGGVGPGKPKNPQERPIVLRKRR